MLKQITKTSKPLFLFLFAFLPYFTAAEQQARHGSKAVIEALKSEIPEEYVVKARELDDKLMAEGKLGDQKVYLVTDKRSDRVNLLTHELLSAMGESKQKWVVRVLDTDEPVVNAFVTGGTYIYVFTGLIDQASSNDELAFILSHELGHSLLKQFSRERQDSESNIIKIVGTLAKLSSKKSAQNIGLIAQGLSASYGQADEAEADALAVAITTRAGYEPLRGIDFFSRSIREQESSNRRVEQIINEAKAEVEAARALCTKYNNQLLKQVSSGRKADPALLNSGACEMALRKHEAYTALQKRNITLQLEAKNKERARKIFGSHPPSQERIAAIAALTDYVKGRRPIDSLSKYEQAHYVMQALNKMDSVLLKPKASSSSMPQSSMRPDKSKNTNLTIADKLQQLKNAYESGLLSKQEYEEKRSQVLNQL